MRCAVLGVAAMSLVLLGVGARPAVAQCPDAANLVSNCGFEVDNSGWTAVRADTMTRSLVVARSGGASLMGDAQELASDWRLTVETCVDVAPSTDYDSGAYLQLLAGLDVACRIYINFFDDDVCTSFAYGDSGDWVTLVTDQWSLVDFSFTSDVNTEGVLLDVECSSETLDFIAYLDDAFLGIGMAVEIFADGFETGGTGQWSATVPPGS